MLDADEYEHEHEYEYEFSWDRHLACQVAVKADRLEAYPTMYDSFPKPSKLQARRARRHVVQSPIRHGVPSTLLFFEAQSCEPASALGALGLIAPCVTAGTVRRLVLDVLQ